MPVINETHAIAGEQITASLLIWRRFKLPSPGLIEAVLEANRDLADQGQHLPLGAAVVIPIDTDIDYRLAPEYRLWDEK